MNTVTALFMIMVGPGLLALGLAAGGLAVAPWAFFGSLAVVAILPPMLFALLWKKHVGLSYLWAALVLPAGYMTAALGTVGALYIHCQLVYCPPL
jgi:hypothetical protein